MDDWVKQIESEILGQNLLKKQEGVLVAVSGGLDSMVMLSLLHELAKEHLWELHIAHFNHQLRGRSSDADEKFVVKTAQRLGLRVSTGRGDVRAFASRKKVSIEMAARQLRHAFLAKTARREGLSKIALAHHADDQVELFFLRLQRGAGRLAGMKWQVPSPIDPQIMLIRPLLSQTRERLERFAIGCRVRFREDATNAALEIPRNRIRHEIVPILKQQSPPIFGTILRSMEIVGAEADFVATAARTWQKERKVPFSELHVALQRRILHDQLSELGVGVDFGLVEHLRLFPGVLVSVGPGLALSRSAAGDVSNAADKPAGFSDESMILELGARGECEFSGVHFRWAFGRGGSRDIPRLSGSEWFDADQVGGKITLRHWRPGDRFQPIGFPCNVKLQDLFVNAKVPAAERHRKVVAVAEVGEIFWVESLRISERFKLVPGTRRQIKWCWKTA